MSRHSARFQWSDEDQAYIATVPEIPGLSAFGVTIEEAARELTIAKEAFLAVMQEDGEEIPAPDVHKPFSGQIRVRLPKSLHESLSFQAKKEGVSLNTHIVHLLSERTVLGELQSQFAAVENRIHTYMLMNTPTVVTTVYGASSYPAHVIDSNLRSVDYPRAVKWK